MNLIETIFWLALTVYYEGRGEPIEGQFAITKTILNRAKKNNWPVSDVVKARKQFSCYNKGMQDPGVWVREPLALFEVTKNVAAAYTEWLDGKTLEGATHYYAPAAMVPKGAVPYWVPSMQLVGKFGNQIFYREV